MALMAVVFTAFALAVPAAYAAVNRSAEPAANQTLTWTAGDDYTQYTSAPATAVAGKTTIVFESSAATGNTTGLTHTLTFDTANGDYNNDVSLNILASPFDSEGGRHTAEVTLTPGVYRYFCAMPGHQMMVGELVVTAAPGEDTTAPQASASVAGTKNDAGEYVDTATVTLSATDTESGVDTIEYALDDAPYKPYTTPVAVSATGQHTLAYRATDKAGNTSTAQSVNFTVTAPEPPKDTTAPDTSATVTGTKNSSGEYVSDATVTVSATDAESGVDTIEYALDGAAYKPYTAPVSVNTAGQHTLTYRATDKAGNTSTAQSVNFTVAAAPPKDETAPAVSASVAGTKNDAGEYVDTATVTLSATDTESGVDTIEYALDDAPYKAYTTPVSVNTAGQHTLTYRATDKAGNTSTTQSVNFTVTAPEPPKDTTAPDTSATVTGTRNSSGEYVSNATVTVTASDTESGVDTIEYALDGAAYKPYTAPVTVSATGQHTLAYRATDRAGNTSAAQSVNFTVVAAPPKDRTAPEVSASVSGTKDDAGAYVGSATVTVTASDTESGVAGIEYSLDGGPYLGYSGPVAITKSGSHTVLYRASDKAGNTSTPKSLSLTVVDGRPPAGCAETDDRPTVFTGLVNTGVPNRVTTNGCTINELIEDHRAWKNHGAFVSHVGDIVNTLRKEGVIDQREAAAIKKAAARSDVGMQDRGPDGR
ncbi:OmpL47-type beta-barrel domain-containing protein [Streptomyces sp. NPDC050421]|uniref:OmpL47-type beta-barrel domain-containing protein n=1 Tax=Streptomyces sp. NPDC050421 TaxID=3365613 RepID=UPI0037ACEC1A